MAMKPKEGERRNGLLVGEDGLTNRERGTARNAEVKAERAPRLAAIVEKHGVKPRRDGGLDWTTPAVSEFLWKEFRFTLFKPYVNDGSGKHGVPLLGRCEKCGEVSRPH